MDEAAVTVAEELAEMLQAPLHAIPARGVAAADVLVRSADCPTVTLHTCSRACAPLSARVGWHARTRTACWRC